jgi:hypothetical protein
MSRQNPSISVECPCCGARIVIDPNLGKVIRHELPPPKNNSLARGEAAARRRRPAEGRAAVFRRSAADLESHSQLLERKFEESLDQNRGRPVTRPTRDIDLD